MVIFAFPLAAAASLSQLNTDATAANPIEKRVVSTVL
jgi:hypothetical protein